ncbi:transglutaminase N-terminal domain-containing protein [Tateyamaria armeniaca]|uniref:Transglutaminase N-terminal domain-containing protein n=1 Tax=Tateyamaria armeniaca TaxID=2518930 RepID=A0ABW8UTK6_9RHOB
MRLRVEHKTHYTYNEPVPYALQQVRLRPKSRPGQTIVDWDIEVRGGQVEVAFEDEHANSVDLVSFTPGEMEIEIICRGTVDVEDQAGVVGPQGGYVPLWLFQRSTALTRMGPQLAKLVESAPTDGNPLEVLHALSAHIIDAVPYSTDQVEIRSDGRRCSERRPRRLSGSRPCLHHRSTRHGLSCALRVGISDDE